MLIARSNFASLTTISEDIHFNRSGIIFSLNEDGVIQQASYYGRGYTLIIDFLDDQHEVWTIIQHNFRETYLVWNGCPYQKIYSDIKDVIWGEDQTRIQHSMKLILSAIRQEETSMS